LESLFPAAGEHHPSHLIEGISIAIPLIGLAIAYFGYLGGQLKVDGLVNSSAGQVLKKFWFSGWAMDWLYDKLWVRPYKFLAYILRRECMDDIYNTIVKFSQFLFVVLSRTQTGRLRWYATSMVFGLILVIALLQGVIQ
jgi:NADH-quinone oxidoreductase subunit L